MVSLELKSSAERIGQLYPILVDRLVARIVSNTVRRSVPSREKRELLERLGEIYLNEGVKPGKISHKIMEETGMSYRWVMKYLPDRFKDDAQSERASSAARRAAGENPERGTKRRVIPEFEEPPKGAVMIKVYTNTNFVNVMLEKKFYRQLEEKAKKLETTPDKLINNALLLTLKKLEERQGANPSMHA